ncbi:PPC domain-containing DNA-binding protein [Stappia sp.]|uniref:PPC domain-containing DNA-binding protein n=1 Tax=Stappia sp. TaxID=1870903 RepID=UPI003D0BA1DC
MSENVEIERGRTGRIFYARVHPNEDLVQGVEKICLREGVERCFLRGSLGSLTDACVSLSTGKIRVLRGPAVEVVGLAGEVLPDEDGNPVATLVGLLATPDGTVAGGRFVAGQNPVCVTFEIVLEEWLAEPADVRLAPREGLIAERLDNDRLRA